MLLSKPMRTDDDQNFKLMTLPDHARKIVILNMGAVQMYLISLCSSRMINLLKKYTNQIQFSLQFDIDVSILFIIRANGVDFGSFEVKPSDPGTDQKRFDFGNSDKLTTFSNDLFHGASCMYKYLLERFSCQMRTCGFPSKEDSFDIRRLIGWTNTLMPKLTDITITIPEGVSEHVIKSLEQLQSINIHLDSERHNKTVDIIINGRRFFVLCAEWITLNDLFKLDDVSMYLINVGLTDEELNKFLTAYIRNETGQNLEHMCLTVKRQIDINTVLDGLVSSNVEAKDARKIEENGILSKLTTENFFRIVRKNNEICYVSIADWDEERMQLYIRNFKDEVFKPLRLLKLPSLALEEVIKSMSLMDAFNLSLCSQTLRYFVKHFFKNHKIKLSIEIADFFLFRLESSDVHFMHIEVRRYPEDPEDLEELNDCKRMKIGNASRIPFCYEEPETNDLATYWKDIVEGATEFYSLILDLFDIHFEKLVVEKEEIEIDYGLVVEWINRINVPIEDVHFDEGGVDDYLYSQTIQSQNFRKCVIHQEPSEYFKSSEFRFTDSHVNWQVSNAHWITPENLSDIGSACLTLKRVTFTNQEVNSFFKDLITGKFRNLEYISLGFRNRDIRLRAVMDGLSDPENIGDNWDVRVFNRYGYNLTVRDTIDVEMATGETCSFKFHTIMDRNGIRTGINVFIWK